MRLSPQPAASHYNESVVGSVHHINYAVRLYNVYKRDVDIDANDLFPFSNFNTADSFVVSHVSTPAAICLALRIVITNTTRKYFVLPLTIDSKINRK